MKTVAILLAAGSGKRMNSTVKKQYMEIAGKEVLYYSLKVLQESFIDSVVLVASSGEEDILQKHFVDRYGFTKVKAIVAGGAERYHSVANGLEEAARLDAYDYAFIHDGARPFLTNAILERCLAGAKEHLACVCGMPVKDTIKIADENGFVKETPQRAKTWMVQTPQTFSFTLILSAYRELITQEENLLSQGVCITDDAMVVETFTDTPIFLVEGSYDNIKITTPEDIPLAEKIAEKGE